MCNTRRADSSGADPMLKKALWYPPDKQARAQEPVLEQTGVPRKDWSTDAG